MIILGIDPGIAITGIGVIKVNGNKASCLDQRAIRTDAGTNISERLNLIFKGVCNFIDLYNPTSIAVEELFFNNNAKTAMVVGQARGVAIVAAAYKNVPVFEYTPLQVKQAVVGYGRADKKQIQQMVKVILNLPSIPTPDDVADALAIAICHCNTNSFPLGAEKK
jgi:crossover junction endodeoxyribonuclease RuvC